MTPNRFLSLLFDDFFVFVPYLLLYLAFWAFGLPTPLLLNIFVVLHALNFVLLAYHSVLRSRYRRRTISKGMVFFWLMLLFLLILPGAYVEYPADPWEHFRRIFRWQDLRPISEYPPDVSSKFAYFWMYS